jgi:shikimate dehydrogenase
LGAGVLSYAENGFEMTTNTSIYGIIGNGIDYSLSPVIYRELFALKNIAAIYNVFNVPDSDLEDFVRSARLLPLAGFNVTIPHKRAMVLLLDRSDRIVKQTGAVNLVINRKGRLIGYNTDYEGLRQSIEVRLRFDVKGARVAVLGSGGSAQTLYYYLASRGARSISVYHRSRASLLHFGKFVRRLLKQSAYRAALMDNLIDDLGDCDLCANCTPAPITELVETAAIKKVRRIFELRYGDYPLLKRAHLLGNYMLAVQAAQNFKIMTGQAVTTNRVMRIIDGTRAYD